MPNIRHSVTISAPADRIYSLVSQGNGFAQWWAADVIEIGDGAPGVVEIGFFNRATVYRLKARALVSPIGAEWKCETGIEWAGTHLLFQIAEKNGKSLVRFTHADWREETEYSVDCNTVWGHLMFRLKAAAEGRSPGPLFTMAGLGE